jgi:hypothetical protein
MTLVLTSLTQHEVIQVSDRRFTYLSGGSVVRRDDERNKAVLFCGRLMFGFTGLGELGMERQTDMWLAGRICDVIAEHDRPGDQGSVLHGVASKATELFRKPRYRGHRHAFVGAGWARFNAQDPEAPARLDECQPYRAVVSNFHDEERELANPASEFSLQTRILDKDEGVFIFDAPHHLSESEREQLKADLLEADSARDLPAMVSILGGTVRGVAARDDGVGQGLMINCLPRATLGTTELMVVASEPLADAQTFLYVPPSGDTTIQLGPVSTCGGTIMSGFQAGAIPPGTPPTQIPSEVSLPDDPPGLVRRWYLVPIAGSGTGDDPYHAETLGRGGSAVIPSHGEGHPRHGHPKHDVALVLVSSDDHGPLEADPRIFPIADLADLDLQVADLAADKLAWITAVAGLRQVSVDGLARDVVRRLGRQLEPEFDETQHWAA